MRYRRCKVNLLTPEGWIAKDPPRHVWIPIDRAVLHDEVRIQWGDAPPQNCVIVDLDSLVVPGKLLAHCEDVPL